MARCLSGATIRGNRRELSRFFDYLDGLSPEPLTLRVFDNADGVVGYLGHLRALGLAQASICGASSAIKALIDWLMLHKRLERQPYWTRPRTPPRGVPRSMTEEQVNTMLSTPDPRTSRGKLDGAVLWVLYSTGARVAELCALDKEDLDLQAGTCRLMGKGKKERLAGLVPPAVAAIRAYLAGARPMPKREAAGALFVTRMRSRIVTRTVHSIVVRVAKAAGIRDAVWPHRFRHSFATHLIDAGAPLHGVQKLLGHSSAVTTEIYTHGAKSRAILDHRKHHPRG